MIVVQALYYGLHCSATEVIISWLKTTILFLQNTYSLYSMWPGQLGTMHALNKIL